MLAVTLDPADDGHRTGSDHPERQARLLAAQQGLSDAATLTGDQLIAARAARRHELVAVHDPGYLDALADLCRSGGGELDPDTPVSAGSWDTALLSAGAGLAGMDALLAGRDRRALVLTRPPGHHAERDRGMGFCLVNNVAVTAASLAGRGERVAIFDWDVHHGNGTQAIFWDDPRVLYVSVHQWPLYPGTGRSREHGGPSAPGTTVNIPLAPRATGDVYLAAFDEVAGPAIDRFAPTWILVSAGFDAHRNDPLGDMRLSAGDFALLTDRIIAAVGSAGRVMLFLEGGYDLGAVRACVAACATQLTGGTYRSELPTSGGPGREFVATWYVRAHQETRR